MSESSLNLIRLRTIAQDDAVHRMGAQSPDTWLQHGLARAQLHEIYTEDPQGGASAAGFAISLTLAAHALPILWLRSQAAERQGGRLHATGLIEFGLSPDSLVLGLIDDQAALLRAAADAARCAGLGTLVIEAWGRCPAIDLTATRRLMLAAEASGVTVLLLRIAAQPVSSAAATRWGVETAASTPLEAGAPGAPAFLVELQRRRGGLSGQRWRVEWNRDACRFEPRPNTEALPGSGLSLAAGGAAAEHPSASVRRA